MPIEIKELHIRVTVNAPGDVPVGVPSAVQAAGGGGQEVYKDAIVAECVEQVLEILQNKAER
jgi:hypothetical protein